MSQQPKFTSTHPDFGGRPFFLKRQLPLPLGTPLLSWVCPTGRRREYSCCPPTRPGCEESSVTQIFKTQYYENMGNKLEKSQLLNICLPISIIVFFVYNNFYFNDLSFENVSFIRSILKNNFFTV